MSKSINSHNIPIHVGEFSLLFNLDIKLKKLNVSTIKHLVLNLVMDHAKSLV